MDNRKKTAPEAEARRLSNEDYLLLIAIANGKFTAAIQGIVIPDGLDDQ